MPGYKIIICALACIFAKTYAQTSVTCAKLSAAYLISDCCNAGDQQTAMVSAAALGAICPTGTGQGLGQSVGDASPPPPAKDAVPPPPSPVSCDDEICN